MGYLFRIMAIALKTTFILITDKPEIVLNIPSFNCDIAPEVNSQSSRWPGFLFTVMNFEQACDKMMMSLSHPNRRLILRLQ